MSTTLRLIATGVAAWALVLLPVHPLTAHESWAEQVILVHFGDPGEDSYDSYKPEQIRDVTAIAADGAEATVGAVPVGEAAVLFRPAGAAPAAVFYTMQLGNYIITDGKRTKATAEEAAKAEKTWTGSYTVTSVFAWQASLAQPRGRSIELVPQVDPLGLKAGEPLPLRVYRDGKPFAGASWKPAGKDATPVLSDAEGRISVPVAAGHQAILVRFNQVDGGKTVGHLAVLSFTHP